MPKRDDVISYVFASQADKDAARRIHETVALHLMAVSLADAVEGAVVGKWCIFALADGTSPDAQALYDSKAQALATQNRPKDFCYLKITPDGISPEDAWRFLRINRHPMIDTTAPEHIHAFDVLPHMSNLSRAERRSLAKRIEEQNG